MPVRHLTATAALWLVAVAAPSLAANWYPLWDGRESVADYAKRVDLPAMKRIDLGDGVALDLVLIPAGKFIMGGPELEKPAITVPGSQVLLAVGASLAFALLLTLFKFRRRGGRFSFSLGWLMAFCLACSVMVGGVTRWHLALKQAAQYAAEKPMFDEIHNYERRAHPVTLSQPFYMGKSPVTQAQYNALIGKHWNRSKGPALPVDSVTWYEAAAFCKLLTARMNGKTFEARLPTEAQWEYACRAGTTTAYYCGDLERDLETVAWYKKNSFDSTQQVDMKAPNRFGLFDMHGNVWQWCADAYTADYEAQPAVDPIQEDGPSRILRGGSYCNDAGFCRSTVRQIGALSLREHCVGFRVVVIMAGTSR